MFLIFSFILFLALNYSSLAAEPISVCFYTNWAQYRVGIARFLPESIDVSLCSHIDYAFARIDINTHEIKTIEWNDVEMMGRVNALKNQKPSLKTIISVGGWNSGYQEYSAMVTDASTRKIFIDSVIVFLNKYKFDGISVDWEYPGNRGSPASDKHRYTLLLKEMQIAFEEHAASTHTTRFIMSASVGAAVSVIESAYEISEIAKHLDWVNIMTYDLHGSWEPVTASSTAMAGPLPTTPNSLHIWLNAGMPANKISLSLASYGRSFHLYSSEYYGLGARANGPGDAGKYTHLAGTLSFYEICGINWANKTTWQTSKSGVGYASVSTQWVGYDNVSSIQHKVTSLVNTHKLKGIAFWSLDYDDFTGTLCKLGKYPLLTKAVHSLTKQQYVPVVNSQVVPDDKIRFQPYNFNFECKASPRWRHTKSLTTWCRDHCKKQNDCPTFICTCY